MRHQIIIKAIKILILMGIVPFLFAAGGGEKNEAGQSDGAAEDREIIVFNAASTTDLINEFGELFKRKYGITVKTNPASSGTLANQIEKGAPCDVFISASQKWMDYVEDIGLVEKQTPFVKNRLVLIAPKDTGMGDFTVSGSLDFPALFSGRLSMGDPAHVPAGKYAQEALEHYGWYTPLQDRIQPAADVRAALLVVEMGETELGVVYETDAKKSDKVIIVSKFPEESHTPITYFSAVLKGAKPEGEKFLKFLLSDPEAAKIYGKYGFSKE